jgi:tryptophan-rich sensory protein
MGIGGLAVVPGVEQPDRAVKRPLVRLLPNGSGGEQTLSVSRSHDVRGLAAAMGPPLAAAVAGNAFIGRDSLRWFRQLRQPRLQLPLPAFGLVGATYYVQMGTVLYRAYLNRDSRVRHLALIVLAGNELWNVAFIGRRSPRNGFAGTLAFLVPLLALQRSVTSDRPSMIALTPYTLWVVAYDVPWSYRLWRLNPS